MAPDPVVRLSPGVVPADIDRAEELQELRRTELERVRKTAENWRTGLAGLLALIATVTVVKGRDTITDLASWAKVAVGIALLVALICAAVGGYLALRAAYGWPEQAPTSEQRKWRYQRSLEAVRDLRRARNLTAATLVFLVAAIGLTWYSPTDPPAFVSASYGDQEACGELVRSDDAELTLEIDRYNTEAIPLDQLTELSVVEACE